MKLSFALANRPLGNIFIGKHGQTSRINLLIIFFGVILFSIAAQISLPLYPFSITLLDTAVFFCAMAFGPKLTTIMLLVYFTLAAVGIPILIGAQAGIHTLIGHRAGGYYVGLIPATIVTGYLVEHGWGQHFITTFFAGLLGMGLFLSIDGVVIGLYYGANVAWSDAVSPVLEINFLKLIALSAVIPQIWQAVNEPKPKEK